MRRQATTLKTRPSEKKTYPIRTCRGCGVKKMQSELVRHCLQQGQLVVDNERKLPGRGVYCCNNDQCRHRLEKNKKVLKQAFRLNERREMKTGASNE